MRALTIRQPWASLIVAGIKDVENRSWRTNHRGPLLIHAGTGRDPVDGWRVHEVARLVEIPRGALIGMVDVVGCVRDSPSRWARPAQWHWELARPWPLPRPVPLRGRLGLFEVDVEGLDGLDLR
ncbi:MAG TPA: ASCH domain-containing protein [Candidatus Dormibacteraeota bacterium]|nr:ASCH domain-containing protein [Candidatus Dormibacteraeota bacterium]